MYQDILVPTDGSAGSERVADHAAELAATTGATLHAIYVVDRKAIQTQGREPVMTDVAGALRESGERALDQVAEVAAAHDVPVTTEQRQGVPHRSIVEYADDVGADVIVMGTHGRRGLERYVLGSVTEHVLRVADQPVLAVKLEAAAVTDADAATTAAREAVEDAGGTWDGLRDDPYRERSTWVVPARTAPDGRVNVHVDAVSGETRVAHLDGK